MLKSYDWQCNTCEYVIRDSLDPPEQKRKKCPNCGKMARKIISARGSKHHEAPYYRTMAEVADKEDKSPITQDFIRSPNSTTYDKWRKQEGVRLLEDGEPTITQKDRDRMREERMPEINRQLAERHMKRQRIEIRE